ncbi:hypothetical protein D3C84_998020 [compost metagenome]
MEHRFNLTAYHHLNQCILIQFTCWLCSYILSITEYRNIVTNLKDLIHFVRNIDNGHTFFHQGINNAEQMINFLICNR